jgi:hypothetical protein
MAAIAIVVFGLEWELRLEHIFEFFSAFLGYVAGQHVMNL